MKKTLVVFICLISVILFNCQSQNKKDVLEPADNNEARLNRLQPPGKVMDFFGINPGMSVAEIGAGKGRYVVHLATRVGNEGVVYAEDINRKSLEFLEKRCREGGLENVKVIHGEVTDPLLPEGKLDRIFIISSYHHFDDPVALLKNARNSLKPDGKVAIGEWVKKDNQVLGEGRTPEKLEEEMKEAGYKLDKIDKSLKGNNLYLYLFSKAKS